MNVVYEISCIGDGGFIAMGVGVTGKKFGVAYIEVKFVGLTRLGLGK